MKIDLSSLPKIARISPSLCISDELIESLADFPKCQSRVKCAQHFAWLSQADDADIHPPDDKYSIVREGYLRAALAEYGAIRDLFKKSFFAKYAREPKYTASLLLRIFQELRNLEFHLDTSELSNSVAQARLVLNFSSGDHHEEYRYTKWILEFDRQEFMRLTNVSEAKGWSRDLTILALDWFYQEQSRWGIQPLFSLALEEYVSCIVHYVREQS